MIRISQISFRPEHNPDQLVYEVARLLKISASSVLQVKLVRRSVDARKKPDVRIVYTVDVQVKGNEEKILRKSGCKRAALAPTAYYCPPKCCSRPEKRPVVVGFGPAGMFAALILAQAGLCPLVLERGQDALTRHEKVTRFFRTGELDQRSNVQFGEGGAGTFSDGKLNTGINNPRIQWVLEQMVSAGAGEDILFDAKPHVGTDVLLSVVQNIRNRILSLGGEIRFESQVTGLLCDGENISGVCVNDSATIMADRVILAIGHSARDTFSMLEQMHVAMEPKPFSLGVRIEHLQSAINAAQYGQDNPVLPPADYKLVKHLECGTVYTFCMCPGGYVVAAASEEGRLVTNGMSYADRGGINANAALLVTVHPSEFPEPGPLGGMRWQQQIEEKAFAVSGNYFAPAQLVGDFLAGKASIGPGRILPTYRPGVTWCDLGGVLPPKVVHALKQALLQLNGNLKGFADPEAVLTAPETRSSSPVRILRNERKNSVSVKGLYPCGEGAGYAGGIISAAVDGIACAEALMESL